MLRRGPEKKALARSEEDQGDLASWDRERMGHAAQLADRPLRSSDPGHSVYMSGGPLRVVTVGEARRVARAGIAMLLGVVTFTAAAGLAPLHGHRCGAQQHQGFADAFSQKPSVQHAHEPRYGDRVVFALQLRGGSEIPSMESGGGGVAEGSDVLQAPQGSGEGGVSTADPEPEGEEEAAADENAEPEPEGEEEAAAADKEDEDEDEDEDGEEESEEWTEPAAKKPRGRGKAAATPRGRKAKATKAADDSAKPKRARAAKKAAAEAPEEDSSSEQDSEDADGDSSPARAAGAKRKGRAASGAAAAKSKVHTPCLRSVIVHAPGVVPPDAHAALSVHMHATPQ